MIHSLLLALSLLVAPPKVINRLLPVKALVVRDISKNYIVIHYDSGDYASTRRTLIRKSLSYHYYVKTDGTVVKFMDPKYKANHAGSSMYQGLFGMNNYSIGICLEHRGGAYTKAQYNSTAWLINILQSRFSDTTSRVVIGHSDVAIPRGRKKDPGKDFDWVFLHSQITSLRAPEV